MNKLSQLTVQKIIYGLLVVFMAAGLKYVYSQSASDNLAWILGPTAALVSFFTGAPFVKEASVGYVCTANQVAIVPACAGINFMIAAFCMSALTFIYSTKRKQYLPLCVLAGGAAAYAATLCANSLRIILSIYLYRADIYTVLITQERVHRIAGVAIYFICLYLLYFGIRKFGTRLILSGNPRYKGEDGRFKSSLLVCLTPLFWYLMIALALPAVNQASGKNPALFREHAQTVGAVSLILFMLMFLGVICYKSQNTKPKTTGISHEIAHSDRGR